VKNENHSFDSKPERFLVKSLLSILVFTGLICLGAQIRIPMGEVPIVMTSLIIYTGSLILGANMSFSATLLYLIFGSLGLPVFSGGSAGYQHLIGPTGGYLIGFALSAFVIGRISEKQKKLKFDIPALLAGSACIHGLGILWMSIQFPDSWLNMRALYPVFLLADTLKIFVAFLLAYTIRPFLIPRQNIE
jgi:biotin transport system substrate-specific component